MYASQNAEIMIACGLHMFQHGRIASIDQATEIPFAHVELRGTKGQLLQRSGAYVPLKYCVEIDSALCDELHAAAKAAKKALRAARKAAQDVAPAVDGAPLVWGEAEL